jgi:uncharacterized damage-inducible protein DinB
MMIARALQTLFGLNAHVMSVNLEGITHEDSLIRPREDGHCMNWILGHIIANRNPILHTVGGDPIWTDEEALFYQRGSQPFDDGSAAHSLSKLIKDFTRSQQQLQEALESIDEERLATASTPDGSSPGEILVTLAFHESYHAGQIGLLRRILGKPGAIR